MMDQETMLSMLKDGLLVRNMGDAELLETLETTASHRSPWTDMTANGASYTQREALDPMLTERYIQSVRSADAPGADYNQPEFSPLFADLSALPPTLIQRSAL